MHAGIRDKITVALHKIPRCEVKKSVYKLFAGLTENEGLGTTCLVVDTYRLRASMQHSM